MRKRLLVKALLFVFCASPFALSSQNMWIQRDSVNGPPKSAAVGFSLNYRGYIGTGWDGNSYKRSFFVYDVFPGDDWTKQESLGGIQGSGLNRGNASCFVIDSFAYVGTGQGLNPHFGDLWQYNPIANTWTQKANFGGTPRLSAVGFSIGDKGYIGTGQDADSLTNDFWEYDPATNFWTQVAPFPGTPRWQAVAFTIDSFAYVGTGDDGIPTDDFWKYDPFTNAWTPIADFAGTARFGAVGFSIDTSGFFGTGQDFIGYYNDFWKYTPSDDAWTQMADFGGTPRASAVGFSIGNTGYIGTGYDGGLVDDFWEYLPVVGVEEHLSHLYRSTVFPNPLKQTAAISIHARLNTDPLLMLYSMDGKNVTGHITFAKVSRQVDKTSLYFDVGDLPSGGYYYRVLSDEKDLANGKILVIK